jgi:hypothetical protein
MPMSKPQLLVLDYPGRRTEARVADLMLESHGFAVRYLLTPPLVRELRAAEYAAALLDRTRPNAGCAGVVGYCMAAPIAQELAAQLAAGHPQVPLLLFDGEPASPGAIGDQYRAAATQYVEQLGGSADPKADPRMVEPDTLAHRPAEAVELMRQSLVALGVAALGGDEADTDAADAAEEIAEFYLDWLVHLVAANNTTWPSWGGPVLHLVSRDHRFTGDWPGATDTTLVRLDVARPGLLRDPQGARAVTEFIKSAGRS